MDSPGDPGLPDRDSAGVRGPGPGPALRGHRAGGAGSAGDSGRLRGLAGQARDRCDAGRLRDGPGRGPVHRHQRRLPGRGGADGAGIRPGRGHDLPASGSGVAGQRDHRMRPGRPVLRYGPRVLGDGAMPDRASVAVLVGLRCDADPGAAAGGLHGRADATGRVVPSPRRPTVDHHAGRQPTSAIRGRPHGSEPLCMQDESRSWLA